MLAFGFSEWAQADHVRHRYQVKLTIDGSPTAFLITDLEFFQKVVVVSIVRPPFVALTLLNKSMSDGATKRMVTRTRRKLSFESAAAIGIEAHRHYAPSRLGFVWLNDGST
jgi:hypothetical protein